MIVVGQVMTVALLNHAVCGQDQGDRENFRCGLCALNGRWVQHYEWEHVEDDINDKGAN